MTTEKLYYQNPYIQSFSSRILQCETDELGCFYAVLKQTAFYPTGGGQPHDTGTINDVQVYDVEEVDGVIRHYIDRPLEEKECYGEVNWERRFDHMQQHAGQHILSAAFEDMFGYKTVSFHLGKEVCSIDLDVPKILEEEASQVEERANVIILENRPIEAKWVTQDELRYFPLRKAISVNENIRLVIIPDYDYNGCGGTHPKGTGQVSSIKILHWEKEKKKIRVHFVCGNRVRKQLHEKHQVIQGLNPLLKAPQENLEAAAKRLLDKQEILEKTISELKKELLLQEEDKLIYQAKRRNNCRMVKEIYSNRPMGELQQLARNVTQKADNMLVFMVNEKEDKLQVVCARSEDVGINMKAFITDLLPKINGKGGGSETIAQGGGNKLISSDALLEEMIKKIDTWYFV
ncbi:alanyl-tRNA synthetase [Salinibacillus kushneri]|uniref:Alanine--tRNA ligase n=1 Tax=Salinibacillus kushneri TaxID=237682 RepID=A0A1I0IM49_9BACI|nr:DHHA1 domain-containing protein [Salinibacillus kushneri]SET98180.1 alanyl-tRNA synthetase [Salinibacillus kushneri]